MSEVPLGRAVKFVERLKEFMEIEGSDPIIAVASDAITTIAENGAVHHDSTGAEAILIVTGPPEGRARALAQLIAQVDTH